MTVGELVGLLQAYPSDLRVVVLGYENGYDDITQVRKLVVRLAENSHWYDGRYEGADPETPECGERAVLLFGRSRDGE